MKNTLKRFSFIILLFSLLTSCNSETEEIIDKTNKTFSNGITMTVEKVNKETTSRGIFTNHNYGTSHSYTYSFSIKEGKINWDRGSGEPKHIIFHQDTTYISYLKNKVIKTKYTDSITNTTQYNHHSEIRAVFQQHIDKRYFFKLFGDDYWNDITPEHYNSVKKLSEEFSIPNDNELTLLPAPYELIKNDSIQTSPPTIIE